MINSHFYVNCNYIGLNPSLMHVLVPFLLGVRVNLICYNSVMCYYSYHPVLFGKCLSVLPFFDNGVRVIVFYCNQCKTYTKPWAFIKRYRLLKFNENFQIQVYKDQISVERLISLTSSLLDIMRLADASLQAY